MNKRVPELSLNECIHIFENCQLTTDNFESDAVTAAYVAALVSLREKQEREKGCEFCKGNPEIRGRKRDKQGLFIWVDTNFCPECGRRLV